jgi:hypothetical protein
MGVLRRVDIELFSAQTRGKFSDLWETSNHISIRNQLWGSIVLRLKGSYSTEVFLGERFNTSGLDVYGGGQWTRQIFFSVLYRYGGAVFYSADPYQGRGNLLTASLIYQPMDQLRAEGNFTYSDFYRESDGQKIYDYPIVRGRLTYQLSKYLFFRGIVEYNGFRKEVLTDLLASFTYIPGTVVHLGYGALYERVRWQNDGYIASDQFLQTRRRFFFKTSYLWRL